MLLKERLISYGILYQYENCSLRNSNTYLHFAVLVLVFVVYNRRREAQIKYPNPDDDVRENIINYEDEGGGEDDMTAFDITPLQIPVADPSMVVGHHPHHFHSLPRPQKVPSNCKFWPL